MKNETEMIRIVAYLILCQELTVRLFHKTFFIS